MLGFVEGCSVSTHSRPKAAGNIDDCGFSITNGFNTQPPEGGWPLTNSTARVPVLFQHTAARRRLVTQRGSLKRISRFQHTAARRRLGDRVIDKTMGLGVSTHSRPKAAGLVWCDCFH